jgi:D-alanyl-D-alanine dipeptidase
MGIFVLKRGVQKYRFTVILSLWLIILTIEGFSQSNENQLIVLNKISAYQSWINENGHRLVPLREYVNPLYFSLPYGGKQNFTGKKLYRKHSFWVLDEVASRIVKVQDSLKTIGLSLFFFDTYRPYAVTKKMWKIVPDERYAANPAKGSGHNRGVAVDVSLAYLKTGKPLPMPTAFDNFTDTAHHSFTNLPDDVLKNRAILKGIMEYFGFRALSTEWWHFSLPDGSKYPLLDLKFNQLKKIKPQQPVKVMR